MIPGGYEYRCAWMSQNTFIKLPLKFDYRHFKFIYIYIYIYHNYFFP